MKNEKKPMDDEHESEIQIIRVKMSEWKYAPEFAYLETAEANECEINPDLSQASNSKREIDK
jgi:hypothetical protein